MKIVCQSGKICLNCKWWGRSDTRMLSSGMPMMTAKCGKDILGYGGGNPYFNEWCDLFEYDTENPNLMHALQEAEKARKGEKDEPSH